jgi:Saxitoxin biosynthesis operon protein SxtJ
MRWFDELNPAPRKLRHFSGWFLLFFIALAIWTGVVRGHPWIGIILAFLAITVGFSGLLKPEAVKPIFVCWMIVSFPIGWLVSHVALALLFYLIFTPVGLFFRLKGRDPLQRKFCSNTNSYWTNKVIPDDVRTYFDQS